IFVDALLRCTIRCGAVPSRQYAPEKGTLVHTPSGAVMGMPRGIPGPPSVVAPPVPLALLVPPSGLPPPLPVEAISEPDEAHPARAAARIATKGVPCMVGRLLRAR